MSLYYDENGNLRSGLLSDEAERDAKNFVLTTKPITSAQLRKFYNEFKGLEKKQEFEKNTSSNEDMAFMKILPLVKMVKSKVAYASNPKGQKVPKEFAEWLSKHVEEINCARDFKAFLLHFEAVVGFCYGCGLKNN